MLKQTVSFVMAVYLNLQGCRSSPIFVLYTTALTFTAVALQSLASMSAVLVLSHEHIQVVQLQPEGLLHNSIYFTKINH